MTNAEEIKNSYIDFVLTYAEPPKSVYNFAKQLNISESDFYNFYASFNAIEKAIWEDFTIATILKIREQEIWPAYSAREKMLSFFYSFIELLKSRRSFIIYSLKKDQKKITPPDVLSEAKTEFLSFSEDVINEGLDSRELVERKFFSRHYKDALWLQFVFIVRFWANDDSRDFEKTDEAIEKGINLAFDFFQRSPIDNLFEYGKFMARNGKFKEKMGI